MWPHLASAHFTFSNSHRMHHKKSPLSSIGDSTQPRLNHFRRTLVSPIHQKGSMGPTIPHMVHFRVTNTSIVELPPLNHDAMLKIKCTGTRDTFVFYNQLLNSMEQFGVFLVPLSALKHNESLCPAQYMNVPITPKRYQSMASTLY